MRRFRVGHLLSVLILICSASIACAQTGVVTPATVGAGKFSSLTSGPDQINLGNLDIHLQIPLYTAPGRGVPVTYYLQYDSNFWKTVDSALTPSFGDFSGFGWVYPSYEEITGSIAASATQTACGPSYPFQQYIIYERWSYTDPSGQTTSSPQAVYNPCTGTNEPANGWSMYGDQFYHTDAEYPQNTTVTNNSGTMFSAEESNPATEITDRNGNNLGAVVTSGNVSGVDTLGRSVTITPGGICCGSSAPVLLTYRDTNSNPQSITINFNQYTVQTNFQLPNVSDYGAQTEYLPTSVVYPDTSSYQFAYEQTPGNPGSVTGRLSSVTLPTGGVISYQYTGPNNGMLPDNSAAGLTRTTSNGTTTYARSNIVEQPAVGTDNVILPVSSTTTVTYQALAGQTSGNQTVLDFVAGTGPVYGTFQDYFETRRRIYSGSSSSGSLLRTISTCYNGTAAPCTTTAVSLPFTSQSVTTTLENGLSSQTVTSYNQNELPTEVDVYDYGATSPLQKTLTAYQQFSTNINTPANSPASVTVKDGSGNTISQTTYGYDACLSGTPSGIPQHTANVNSGNVSSVSQSINSTGASLVTTNCFDGAGQKVLSTFNNATTGYAYDSVYDAFQTGITYPTPSSGVALSVSAKYDPYYGALQSTTDENLNVTTYANYNWAIRPTEIDYPDGGKLTGGWGAASAGFDRYMNSGSFANVVYDLEGYGRPNWVAVQNASGGYYLNNYCYDSDGNLQYASYRFAAPNPDSLSCSGAGDSYTYDALGRVLMVTHADSSTIHYSYNSRATQLTDENGVSHITQVDALGRTIAVCELSGSTLNNVPPVNCGLDISGTGFLTTYSYLTDTTRNNALQTEVYQGQQMRAFETDWLGRTTLVGEPESANNTTYSYAYLNGSSGLGLTVTRKRPQANQSGAALTTTTTQYDSLGRVVSVSYDDNLTPSRSFVYDVNNYWAVTANNLKGRLAGTGVGAQTQSWNGSVMSYDAMGRVVGLWQCGPSTCGTANQTSRAQSYAYDWAGNLTMESDGGSGTITYGRSVAGEVTSITNETYQDQYDPANLVSNVVNGPNGPTSYALGNGLNVYQTYDQLGRLQGRWVCNGPAALYCNGGTQIYGTSGIWKGSQMQSQQDTVIGQFSYYYDEFNRLTDRIPAGQTSPDYAYGYDRYGNRFAQAAYQGGFSFYPNIDPTTNHITTSGFTYDAAGNMTNDATNGAPHSFQYDAEGNILTVDHGNTATYVYDAFNRRIEAPTSTGTTEFTYDYAGRRISAWLSSGNVGYQARIYWDNEHFAFRAGDGTNFEHQDTLGTERVRTMYNGSLGATYKSLPWGDDYTATIYNSYADEDNLHYAGTERDAESGTEHAQFRNYDSAQGRWLAPDPDRASYDFSNPQSLNRYTYVSDNPLSLLDPRGTDSFTLCDNQDCGLTLFSVTVFAAAPDDFTADYYSRVQVGATPRPIQQTQLTAPNNGQTWKQFGQAAKSCAASSFGLSTAAGAAGVASGLPVVSTAGKFANMTSGTSVASQFFRSILPQTIESTWAPTLMNPIATSGVLGGVVGRWVPVIGEAVLVYQGAKFTSCLWDSDSDY
jgi:RHS repeat-associated protein